MDEVIDTLHWIVLVSLPLAGIVIIFKIYFVFTKRGFSPALFTNFFRIYKSHEFITSRTARKRYMTVNNWLNYFLYTSIFLFLILLSVYKKDIFSF